MMRSLFSGVSGLRTHQTRMDVIGNNIANVNTTAFKAKQMNFSDMLYQTTQAATGANPANNTGGTNPRQIGLGVKAAAINTTITQEGANQSTGNPFDLRISGGPFTQGTAPSTWMMPATSVWQALAISYRAGVLTMKEML